MTGTITSGLCWVRQRQRALARVVLALFVLAWLQTAALPCVMAHDGGLDAPAASHCPYCPPAESPADGCHDYAGCVYPHDPQVDARAVAALFVPVACAPVVPVAVEAASATIRVPAAAPGPIPRVSIPVSYCRFIE